MYRYYYYVLGFAVFGYIVFRTLRNRQNASGKDEMLAQFGNFIQKGWGKKIISKIEIENEKVLKAGEPKL